MHVAVIGGGIAGLSAAWFLRDQDVTVFEGSPRIGGKLRTVQLAGVSVDVGAESILNRRPEGVELARVVGLGDAVTYPETTSAALWTRGTPKPIPGGTVMGIPADLEALADSGILDDEAVVRAARDLELRGDPLTDDTSVGDYATTRLGRDLVERLVEPLLGSVYAGHADLLSLESTTPQLMPYLRSDPSLIRAARALRQQASTLDSSVFAGLIGGVGTLPEAVAAASGAKIRTNAMVRGLARTGQGWRLTVGPTRDVEAVDVDAVVVACPARAAARLLEPTVPNELETIEYASMATIAFAFRREGRFEGSGMLIPPIEERLIKATTYSTTKWGWLAEKAQADQADGLEIARCSVGRHREEAVLQQSDRALIAGALADLRAATGIEADPVDAVVTRWGGSLPQYAVGHRGLVERTRAAVAAQPGLAVAGAAYEGVGIPACVASAKAAADRIRQIVG